MEHDNNYDFIRIDKLQPPPHRTGVAGSMTGKVWNYSEKAHTYYEAHASEYEQLEVQEDYVIWKYKDIHVFSVISLLPTSEHSEIEELNNKFELKKDITLQTDT